MGEHWDYSQKGKHLQQDNGQIKLLIKIPLKNDRAKLF